METTEMEEWEDILKGSASYNMYNKFNAEAKLEEKKKVGAQEKKEEEPDHCKGFKEDGKYKDEAYKLCLRLGPSLEYLHKVVVGGTRRYSCIHYKYWMSYKLLNMFKKVSDNEFDKSVLEKFWDAQDIFVKKYNDYGCRYDYKKIDLNDLKEMDEKKYLHDYFRSYNTVKEYVSLKPSKKEMYKKYLEHINKLYEKYKDRCSDGFIYWTSDCPLYFKRGGDYDPKKLCAQLDPPCLNNDGVKHNKGKEVLVNTPKKKKMTFYYLKCNNEDNQGYRRCALIPSTMEYTENEDESKSNDEEEEEEIPVPPDPRIALGGILKTMEQTTGREAVRAATDSHGNPQISPSASRSDQYNSQYLTEADGISPYLVQTEDGIKWRIDDDETFDCNRYPSQDAYDLCIHLKDLHQKGKIKLNPNPSGRKARRRKPSLEGGNGLSDIGSYQTGEEDGYSSNTWDDIILLLDPSLEVKKEREEILIMNILKENRKSYLDVVNNR
ncbi:VIR protein [Plasmodium vivax]|uniref:VIR protein n=1 Tax=Plasmodium vivax TaxID=5855 RepID=A0A1G4H6K4_PLAVI|nr:VIR protein [Plasmodium vivax]